MAKLQGSWIWYELMTTDPMEAKTFYDAVVGWDIDAASMSPDMDYRMINCPDGGMTGGVFKLNEEMISHGAKPCWLGYIGVDDCDATAKAIESAGGTIVMPAKDVPMAGRIAMVTDCCGAHFFIMTPTPPPGGGESTAFSATANNGRCGWNELMAANAENAAAFYSSQFGWGLPDAMDMGEFGKYQFVAHDDVQTGAIMKMMPQDPHPHWNHYFWVPSIEEAAKAITASGCQVINGPMEVPGGDWIVQGIDPQGAFFSLVGGK
jgi:uncharacterized protein